MILFSIFIALFLIFVYVFGELECYKRGGDVWVWTVNLAKFLDNRK